MCKYEIDLGNTVEDKEWKPFCPQMDGQREHYTPFKFPWSVGIIKFAPACDQCCVVGRSLTIYKINCLRKHAAVHSVPSIYSRLCHWNRPLCKEIAHLLYVVNTTIDNDLVLQGAINCYGVDLVIIEYSNLSPNTFRNCTLIKISSLMIKKIPCRIISIHLCTFKYVVWDYTEQCILGKWNVNTLQGF